MILCEIILTSATNEELDASDDPFIKGVFHVSYSGIHFLTKESPIYKPIRWSKLASRPGVKYSVYAEEIHLSLQPSGGGTKPSFNPSMMDSTCEKSEGASSFKRKPFIFPGHGPTELLPQWEHPQDCSASQSSRLMD